MERGNTDWGRSVAGVVIKEGRVLLARHTYGGGKGLLIVPGGYLERGETPQQAVQREILEETGITVEPGPLLAVRFSAKDWYAVFRAEYIAGGPISDQDENSEVVWMDGEEALAREDVPGLSKELIRLALRNRTLTQLPYDGGNGELYGSGTAKIPVFEGNMKI